MFHLPCNLNHLLALAAVALRCRRCHQLSSQMRSPVPSEGLHNSARRVKISVWVCECVCVWWGSCRRGVAYAVYRSLPIIRHQQAAVRQLLHIHRPACSTRRSERQGRTVLEAGAVCRLLAHARLAAPGGEGAVWRCPLPPATTYACTPSLTDIAAGGWRVGTGGCPLVSRDAASQEREVFEHPGGVGTVEHHPHHPAAAEAGVAERAGRRL